MGDVLRALEGSTAVMECVGTSRVSCDNACSCSARPLWLKLQRRIDEVLDSTTLADMRRITNSSACTSRRWKTIRKYEVNRMRKVYLDNAATTALSPRVLEAMLPYFTQYYGNPSSVHAFGREAKQGLDKARDQVAKALHCEPSEVIFTGCGTESDNTVLLGVAQRYGDKGKHIITTNVEHHAILHTCEYLEKQGYSVTYLPVDQDGLVTAEQVAAAIRPDTILVSIMFANNEVGTIMPIQEIGAVCKEKGVLFHTDAVQAVGHIPVDVQAMHIDMLSLSAHKFHGPKGVGALYCRKGIRLRPILWAGPRKRGAGPARKTWRGS
mgnify:CR=1 FL=1